MSKEFTILTDSNISKDDERIRVAFYANIGYFIQIAQMLEYNLRKLICYVRSVNEIENGKIFDESIAKIHEKYDGYYLKTYKEKFTLGKLKNELRELGIFSPEVNELFGEINDYRAKVVHMLFQNNIVCNEFEASGKVLEYMTKRLVPMSNEAERLNGLVIKTIEIYREDFRRFEG